MFSKIEMTDVLIGIEPIWAETETRLEWNKEKMRSREVEAVCTPPSQSGETQSRW